MPSFFPKPRTVIWYINGFLEKKRKFLLLGFVFSFIVSVYWFSGIFISVRDFFRKENTVGIVGQYNQTNLPLFIQNKISLGLTKITNDDRVANSAALKWEIKESGKKFLFYLNTDLKWSNGQAFKSFDVNYRLKDVEIVAIANDRVEFRLKEPLLTLSSIVSQPLLKENLVGLGEYRVDKIVWKGSFIERINLTAKKNRSKHLIYKFYPSETEAFSALKLKKISRIENLPEIKKEYKNKDFQISSETNYHNITALFFNHKKDSFKEKQVRLGLIYAIPDNIFAGKIHANSPIPQTSWWYYPNVKDFSFNHDLALKYLKDFIPNKESTSSSDLKIKLSTFPLFSGQAKIIADAWNFLGIPTKIEIINDNPKDYDVLLASFTVYPDPDQYFFWHSTQEKNITFVKSPRIDKILEDGRKIVDTDKRREKYQEFQKFLVEEVPAYFLYYGTNFTLTRL